MCLFVSFMIASCTGSPRWIEKQDQETVTSYVDQRINAGRYDLEGLCDRVRKAGFLLAEDPADIYMAATARKS